MERVRKWAVLVGMMSILMMMAVGVERQDGYVNVMPAMYMLGDSSVDCGDNTPFYGLLDDSSLSLFPCNGSDSVLLPHLLANKMGLPDPTPFYSLNGSSVGLLRGVNFGSPRATILYPEGESYQSLNQQLRQAFETIQLLQLQLGQESADRFVRSSVFYLSFGKDDFINYFLPNSSGTMGVEYGTREFNHMLAHQMANAVRDLYARNVRKVVCAGILPLGCMPSMMLEFGNALVKGCVDDINWVVLEYNKRLEESVNAINAELQDAHIVFCDVYRALMEFITNPRAYGIEDVATACCGQGKYRAEHGCRSPDMACPEASTHVWWDMYNPTPTINTMVADSAWYAQPLSSVSRPVTVQELLSMST